MKEPLGPLPEGAPDEVARARLLVVTAFSSLMLEAFDALLHHGVNYRNLPEYKDERLLDEAEKLPPVRSADRYIMWCSRISSGIKGAIRRKGMRKVIDNG